MWRFLGLPLAEWRGARSPDWADWAASGEVGRHCKVYRVQNVARTLHPLTDRNRVQFHAIDRSQLFSISFPLGSAKRCICRYRHYIDFVAGRHWRFEAGSESVTPPSGPNPLNTLTPGGTTTGHRSSLLHAPPPSQRGARAGVKLRILFLPTERPEPWGALLIRHWAES